MGVLRPSRAERRGEPQGKDTNKRNGAYTHTPTQKKGGEERVGTRVHGRFSHHGDFWCISPSASGPARARNPDLRPSRSSGQNWLDSHSNRELCSSSSRSFLEPEAILKYLLQKALNVVTQGQYVHLDVDVLVRLEQWRQLWRLMRPGVTVLPANSQRGFYIYICVCIFSSSRPEDQSWRRGARSSPPYPRSPYREEVAQGSKELGPRRGSVRSQFRRAWPIRRLTLRRLAMFRKECGGAVLRVGVIAGRKELAAAILIRASTARFCSAFSRALKRWSLRHSAPPVMGQ